VDVRSSAEERPQRTLFVVPTNNGEDALIMTTDRLETPEMRDLVASKRRRYATDVLPDDPGFVPDPDEPPAVLDQ